MSMSMIKLRKQEKTSLRKKDMHYRQEVGSELVCMYTLVKIKVKYRDR